jgi:hypothetical protein
MRMMKDLMINHWKYPSAWISRLKTRHILSVELWILGESPGDPSSL